MPELPPILDGHEDFLSALPRQQRDFLSESERGHVDLPRAKRGGLAAAFAAVFLTTEQAEQNATGYAIKQIDDLYRLIERSDGRMRLVRTIADLDRARADGTFGAILHFEGAEPIAPSLKELRLFYEAGLRSIGLAWSRPNAFASGVAFRDPQPTSGLTEAGYALISECQKLGIVLDVSHLNPAGFWDLARAVEGPFLASHSNAKAISPHPRNLDDDQIRAIADHDGTIGITFFVAYLRPDCAANPDTSLDIVMAHFEHIIALVGDRHVSIGSDFDGAVVPNALKDASCLPRLLEEFQRRGWSDERIERVCFGNLRRVLASVWR
ncbi:MAG: dipeptidase [Chloroflexota bacterium]|nr:dipeptidase [Dehalococcoidia bacterium]MDW8253818.1 dipeptidase [Chloroflexota bacterium]